jgi:hypothetical protein
VPRACSVCRHPAREEIDRALATRSATISFIAVQYGVSRGALWRHTVHGHIVPGSKPAVAAAVPAAAAVPVAIPSNPVPGEAGEVTERALEILRRAEESGDIRAMCAAIKEVRGCIGLMSKLNSGANPETAVNVAIRMVAGMSDEEVIARARRALARRG